MPIYSIGDAAAYLTRVSGEYVGTHRVANRVRDLINRGEIPDRRAGRLRILLPEDMAVVESEFGITAEMVAAAGGDNEK